MSRFRLVLLSMLAALVVSAVGAAAAWAEGPVWEVEKAGEWVALSPFEEVEAESEGGPIIMEVAALGIDIICLKTEEEALLFGTDPGTGEATIKVTKCGVLGAGRECKVAEPIEVPHMPTILRFVIAKEVGEKWKVATEAEYEAAPGKGEESALADEFRPGLGSGGVLVTLRLEKCGLISGGYNMTGTELGLTDNPKDVATFKPTLVFGVETSNLKFGPCEATLIGESYGTSGYGTLRVGK